MIRYRLDCEAIDPDDAARQLRDKATAAAVACRLRTGSAVIHRSGRFTYRITIDNDPFAGTWTHFHAIGIGQSLGESLPAVPL